MEREGRGEDEGGLLVSEVEGGKAELQCFTYP